MKRFVIQNKENGKFLKGSGFSAVWVDGLDKADTYRKQPSFNWNEETQMLVPVKLVIIE